MYERVGIRRALVYTVFRGPGSGCRVVGGQEESNCSVTAVLKH